MAKVVALYSGASITNLKLIALTSDPEAVRIVARRALLTFPNSRDPITQGIDAAKKRALKKLAGSGKNRNGGGKAA